MIEYIIRRAIIWAITIAIVFGVTKAISNSTSKALSKSLEKKLLKLGKIENEKDLDEDLIKELIDVNVTRQGGYYLVEFRENIYGIFETSFVAKGKKDAIKKLGKKIFGFTFVNKKILSEEEKDFFLRIWFETYSKETFKSELDNLYSSIESIETNIEDLMLDISYSKNCKSNYENKIEKLQFKLEKFINKNKQKKVEKIKDRIKETQYYIKEHDKNIVSKNQELEILKNEKQELHKILKNKLKAIENPEFELKEKEVSLVGFKKSFKFV